MSGDWSDAGKRQELNTRAETTIELINRVEDLEYRLGKAVAALRWIKNNRFVDTGSKNKATVALAIIEEKDLIRI